MTKAVAALALAAGTVSLQSSTTGQPQPQAERHLRNIRQLTFGGENAEAYFSSDGSRLIFQTTREPYACGIDLLKCEPHITTRRRPPAHDEQQPVGNRHQRRIIAEHKDRRRVDYHDLIAVPKIVDQPFHPR